MPDKTWEELLIWKLTGPRFDEHRGVDLADLAGLVGLRIAIVEVAKLLWKRRFRKKKIPDYAEDSVDLRIKRFDDGSEQATVWLGRPLPAPLLSPLQGELYGSPAANDFASFFESIHEAAAVLQDALRRAAEGEPQLAWFPRDILRQLAATGKSLRADEQWSIQAVRGPAALEPSGNDYLRPDPGSLATRSPEEQQGAETDYDYEPEDEQPIAARTITRPGTFVDFGRYQGRAPAPADRALPQTVPKVDAMLRAKLEALGQPKAPEWRIVQRTLSGEVMMVDVDGLAEGRLGTVRIRPDGHPADAVEIEFLPEHEKYVTGALDKHNNKVRLRVRGDAHLDERGKLKRFTAKRVAEIKAPNPDAMGEELFERLVAEDPDRLLAMLHPGQLDSTLLTFAAEIAGRNLPSKRVVPLLLDLLRHERALVREGALYGLRDHSGELITAEIRRLAETDTSPGVRLVATGVLKFR
jgi:hypothetical protein